jgi:hypothetical protein
LLRAVGIPISDGAVGINLGLKVLAT